MERVTQASAGGGIVVKSSARCRCSPRLGGCSFPCRWSQRRTYLVCGERRLSVGWSRAGRSPRCPGCPRGFEQAAEHGWSGPGARCRCLPLHGARQPARGLSSGRPKPPQHELSSSNVWVPSAFPLGSCAGLTVERRVQASQPSVRNYLKNGNMLKDNRIQR